MQTVSCIVPAYNEADRISAVLESVAGHPLVTEVIVVDDGSTDNTAKVVGTFRNIMIVAHESNKGKSKAIHTGITKSSGEYLFFLDSDLIGLTPANITELIKPVLSGESDVSISLRENSPWWAKKFGLDYISGERVFHRSFLDGKIDEIQNVKGYALEVFMNKIILEKKSKLKVVFWQNTRFVYKWEKTGWIKGILLELKMSYEILQTISFTENIKMYRAMLKLKV